MLYVFVVAALPLVAAPSPACAQCVECPPGAIDEGEACGFGSMLIDPLNCGCTCCDDLEPGAFTPIDCGATYCGEGYYGPPRP